MVFENITRKKFYVQKIFLEDIFGEEFIIYNDGSAIVFLDSSLNELARIQTGGKLITNNIDIDSIKIKETEIIDSFKNLKNITNAFINEVLEVNGNYIRNQSLAFFQKIPNRDGVQITFNAWFDGNSWTLIDDTKESYLFQLDEDENAFQFYHAPAGSTTFNLLAQLEKSGNLWINGLLQIGSNEIADSEGTSRISFDVTNNLVKLNGDIELLSDIIKNSSGAIAVVTGTKTATPNTNVKLYSLVMHRNIGAQIYSVDNVLKLSGSANGNLVTIDENGNLLTEGSGDFSSLKVNNIEVIDSSRNLVGLNFVSQDILPDGDLTRSLGGENNRWLSISTHILRFDSKAGEVPYIVGNEFTAGIRFYHNDKKLVIMTGNTDNTQWIERLFIYGGADSGLAGIYTPEPVDMKSLKIGGTEVIDSSRNLKNVSASRNIINNFFSEPFWNNIPDKPSSFPAKITTLSNETSEPIDVSGEVELLSLDVSGIDLSNKLCILRGIISLEPPGTTSKFGLGFRGLRPPPPSPTEKYGLGFKLYDGEYAICSDNPSGEGFTVSIIFNGDDLAIADFQYGEPKAYYKDFSTFYLVYCGDPNRINHAKIVLNIFETS